MDEIWRRVRGGGGENSKIYCTCNFCLIKMSSQNHRSTKQSRGQGNLRAERKSSVSVKSSSLSPQERKSST